MNSVRVAAAIVAFAFAGVPAMAFAQADEGAALVKIKAKKVDSAALLPGADFSGYKKVMIAPAEVAFQKNWLRDMNNRSMSLSQRLSDKDAQKILEAARSGFDEIWAQAFIAAGYEVVTVAGSDVLKLSPGVFDLYINAPDTMTASRSKTYTVEAGEASLALEARDSQSGTLLGRVVDKRTAGMSAGRMQWTTSVTNRADFGQLFKQWAKIAADGLGDLKAASPLSETMEPGKKINQQ
jgi:hypothetical protein